MYLMAELPKSETGLDRGFKVTRLYPAVPASHGWEIEEIGRYSALEDAILAARGMGPDGESGFVWGFGPHPDDGVHRDYPIIDFRDDPLGEGRVGFKDLREFEYGTRNGSGGPVYTYQESDPDGYVPPLRVNRAEPGEVRDRLLRFPSLVGVWRLAGDSDWRGEFRGSTDRELNRWLPWRYGDQGAIEIMELWANAYPH